MAIAFRNSVVKQAYSDIGGAGSGEVMTKPTGTASGDIWIVGVTTDAKTALTLSGFTRSRYNSTDGVNIFYRFCDGTEGASVSLTGYTAGTLVTSWGAAWSGAPNTYDKDGQLALAGSGETTLLFPTLTPAYAGGLDVVFQIGIADGATTGWTAGWNEVIDDGTTTGSVVAWTTSVASSSTPQATSQANWMANSFSYRIVFSAAAGGGRKWLLGAH